jgi:hypothetical protein
MVAINSRDPERIAFALSPAIWPEDQRSPGDFPEAYAMVEARAMLAMGRQAEAIACWPASSNGRRSAAIPIPRAGWAMPTINPATCPACWVTWKACARLRPISCKTPGVMSGVRRARHRSLAVAFARAGDAERALHYLELLVETFGPHFYAWFAPEPGLDAVRTHPRFLACRPATRPGGRLAAMADFFTELKRRKVFRVAVVYAATAFVVLQAADIMLPRLGIPDWVNALIVLLVILGFPIALVLAWALELTPDGLKRTESAPAAQAGQGPAPALLGKRTVFVAALLVVLGVGIGAGWFLRPAERAGRFAGRADAPGRRPGRFRGNVHRRAAVSEHEHRSRECLFCRRYLRGTAERPRPRRGSQGRLAHLGVLLQGQQYADPGNRAATRRAAHSGRLSAPPGQPRTHHRTADRDGQRYASLVADLRARAGRHLPRAGRNRDSAITTALEDILGTRQVSVDAPTANLEAYEHFLHGRTPVLPARLAGRSHRTAAFAGRALDPEFAEAWAFLAATAHVVSWRRI